MDIGRLTYQYSASQREMLLPIKSELRLVLKTLFLLEAHSILEV